MGMSIVVSHNAGDQR
uniref:Uncharacterized protein n=1 Tax=Anguilla anguilla TaxID=7936 RepID=A0A0E9TBH2_ANGAN